MTDEAISVQDVYKFYGSTTALSGLSLSVERGSVVSVLGPNGAGKTTLTRILATLASPDKGQALVAGWDVASHPAEVRRRIGVTGQSTSLDEYLTGRQNLIMVGQLSRLSGGAARARASELLEQFELSEAADRPCRTYSGGMLRKLDLAASLVTKPEVLFLDEPTTGLDPRARMGMWEVIRGLGEEGTTLLLTTQYLDEADQLADQVAVVDHGRVIAWGTPEELKAQVGGAVMELRLGADANLARSAATVRRVSGEVTVDTELKRLSLPASGSPGLVSELVLALNGEGIAVDEISVHRPALDDVFMTLTGHRAEEESQ